MYWKDEICEKWVWNIHLPPAVENVRPYIEIRPKAEIKLDQSAFSALSLSLPDCRDSFIKYICFSHTNVEISSTNIKACPTITITNLLKWILSWSSWPSWPRWWSWSSWPSSSYLVAGEGWLLVLASHRICNDPFPPQLLLSSWLNISICICYRLFCICVCICDNLFVNF